MFLTEVLEKMKTTIFPQNHAMYTACQITNATDSYSEYVIVIALTWQQL
jgi:hypothetical protein